MNSVYMLTTSLLPLTVEDLASLDPDLYRGLVFLKGYEGNVEDLSLNFTIMNKGNRHS